MSDLVELGTNELHQALARGGNIDRPESVEVAFDIHSGGCAKFAVDCSQCMKRYVREVHELSIPYVSKSDLILDCGAGELTALGF